MSSRLQAKQIGPIEAFVEQDCRNFVAAGDTRGNESSNERPLRGRSRDIDEADTVPPRSVLHFGRQARLRDPPLRLNALIVDAVER